MSIPNMDEGFRLKPKPQIVYSDRLEITDETADEPIISVRDCMAQQSPQNGRWMVTVMESPLNEAAQENLKASAQVIGNNVCFGTVLDLFEAQINEAVDGESLEIGDKSINDDKGRLVRVVETPRTDYHVSAHPNFHKDPAVLADEEFRAMLGVVEM